VEAAEFLPFFGSERIRLVARIEIRGGDRNPMIASTTTSSMSVKAHSWALRPRLDHANTTAQPTLHPKWEIPPVSS
jgi:hypothetical protein